jgi:hypothetical protein
MTLAWISPTNVTRVARALLQLDRIHVQEKYHLDTACFADQLRHALEQYQTPSEAALKTGGTIDVIEAALIRLLAEVKLFVSLLTPKVQQQLAQQSI